MFLVLNVVVEMTTSRLLTNPYSAPSLKVVPLSIECGPHGRYRARINNSILV
jgi:hypothetical protein